MSGGKDLPPPRTDDVLSRRFSLGTLPPAEPHTAHTSHTPAPLAEKTPTEPERRKGEPDGMTRRTYYYDQETADALAEAVNAIHHRTHGRVAKHRVIEAVIRAGLAHLDDVEAKLRAAI
ncbi:hypothetical protein [Pilimelia columellifera]|uniref:Uncharacterized protein n=1 Tax=Pilimelia columellifera subsp. columellifera TaxID=706583 RepID=A0ABN3NUN3_9ACTN